LIKTEVQASEPCASHGQRSYLCNGAEPFGGLDQCWNGFRDGLKQQITRKYNIVKMVLFFFWGIYIYIEKSPEMIPNIPMVLVRLVKTGRNSEWQVNH